MSEQREEQGQSSRGRSGLTVWQVVKSTLAAALGVQTEAARRRDFTRGSPAPFIIAGIVFTAVFVIVLVVIVNVVIRTAG